MVIYHYVKYIYISVYDYGSIHYYDYVESYDYEVYNLKVKCLVYLYSYS